MVNTHDHFRGKYLKRNLKYVFFEEKKNSLRACGNHKIE